MCRYVYYIPPSISHDMNRMNMKSLCLFRSCSKSSFALLSCKLYCGSVSTARKFGDLGTGGKSGDDGMKFGDMGVVVTVEAKFGDVATGGSFGDVETVDGKKFGDVEAVEVRGGKFGDTDFVGICGRKFGDRAKESFLLGAESDVAKRAGKSGDVEADVNVDTSCAAVLGHIASAPSSTWS